ncbi:MAG: ABC transporter ATP-binding protein [Acidimicrobiia bacterium]
MTAVILARGLRRSFDVDAAPVRAVRGLDLTVASGEFVAVRGPSGCGKSTLLNLIAGLDRPDEGSIMLAGEEITGLSERDLAAARRRHVGMVFQFFHLLDGMSALENVMMATMIAGAKRSRAELRARAMLDLLSIADKADQLPGRLSGGQRQRLAIARALANEPTVLLADEPTGALDSEGAAEIGELLVRLNRSGQTIVLVTHDERVAATAGRQLMMVDGGLRDHGES